MQIKKAKGGNSAQFLHFVYAWKKYIRDLRKICFLEPIWIYFRYNLFLISQSMEHLKQIQKVTDDIRTITIQGATNIAKEWMKILGQEILSQKFSSRKEFNAFLMEAIRLLQTARETEPMLFNGLLVCKNAYKNYFKTKKITTSSDMEELQKELAEVCNSYVDEIEKEETIRPAIWAALIKSGDNIATHCHSGSVVKVLTTAWQDGKKIHVYNSETRPLFQWRKTSIDLAKAGVPDTMIPDSLAPFFIDNLYESKVNIDAVFLWSDAIKLDGSVYNKVGSFGIALSARHSKIPVYIVWSIMKIDTKNSVTIEKREPEEVWEDAPAWVQILNYAFDMIPAKFITGIITEHGIIRPKDIKKRAKKLQKGEY